MKKIEEICAEIAADMEIEPVENQINEPYGLKMQEVLDEKIWNQSGIICLAARPSMGKSAFALDMAIDAAICLDKPIVIFSLEMTEKQMVYFMIKKICGVNCRERSGDTDINKIASAIGFLQELNIFIDDTPAISTTEMKSVLSSIGDVGLVIVDYAQLLCNETREFKTRVDELTQITDDLAVITKNQELPMLVISQLSRYVDKQKNPREILDDLSKTLPNIVEKAKTVISLYRDAYYSEDLNDDSAEIIISKNTLGNTKIIKAHFDREYGCFVKQ